MLSPDIYLTAQQARLQERTSSPDEIVMYEALRRREAAEAAMTQLHKLLYPTPDTPDDGFARQPATFRYALKTPIQTFHVSITRNSITVTCTVEDQPHGTTMTADFMHLDCEPEWKHVGHPHLPDGYSPWEWAYDALCRG